MVIRLLLVLSLFSINTLSIDKKYLGSVDFDTSMGRTDQALRPLYTQLIQNLSKQHLPWFMYLRPKTDPSSMLLLLRRHFDRNKVLILDQGMQKNIPTIIHQVWLGKKPFPEKYKRWQKTWQALDGWQYKLWTDEDIEAFPLINRNLYYKEKNMGARADILRIEILYQEGGVYVDTDFECIKPEMFSILNSSYDFYCGLTPLDCKKFVINNAIIGSIPGHPILKACIEYLPLQEAVFNNLGDQVVMKGPGLFTQMVMRSMNKSHKDIVFPPTFFYPLGVHGMKRKAYRSLPMTDETLERIKNDVIKPETLAIHWWDGSWTEPDANIQ